MIKYGRVFRNQSKLLSNREKSAEAIGNLTMTMREKCPNTEISLVRIFPHSDRMQENTDQKKLCIWTLFTQCDTAQPFWNIIMALVLIENISARS